MMDTEGKQQGGEETGQRAGEVELEGPEAGRGGYLSLGLCGCHGIA